MRRWLTCATIGVLVGFVYAGGVAYAEGARPGAGPLPRATPESQGVSSAAVRAFVETANRRVNTLHSFMLVRHGRVIAEGWWEPEAPDKPHVMHSLSKSFTSTAVGLAIAEGKLALDDPVLKFFPDDAPPDPSDNLRAMRVRDLLTMTCGHDPEPKRTDKEPWVRTFLHHPVPHEPGTHFQYNSLGTHVLSAIVGKVTGQTVLEYLGPRLFEPLGIENPQWLASPQGNTAGGWGLYLRTEDLAKFGQLYLQKGKWDGRQLVPEKWVAEATKYQVANKDAPSGRGDKPDWQAGYGYQFWQCQHNAYRGDGAAGQLCIVMPEQDAVLAVTANTGNMQAEVNVVWETLLPAFRKRPLPPDPDEEAKLGRVLASLKVPPPTTRTTTRPQASGDPKR
jgi:CubicO group peptidase (beta-lactamase class C family)